MWTDSLERDVSLLNITLWSRIWSESATLVRSAAGAFKQGLSLVTIFSYLTRHNMQHRISFPRAYSRLKCCQNLLTSGPDYIIHGSRFFTDLHFFQILGRRVSMALKSKLWHSRLLRPSHQQRMILSIQINLEHKPGYEKYRVSMTKYSFTVWIIYLSNRY